MSRGKEIQTPQAILEALPVSEHAPAMACEVLDDLADDLAPDLLRDTKLLVSELVGHPVRCGPPDRVGTLALEVSVTGSGVRVLVVYDRGSASPPTDPGAPVLGWPLQLVAEVADRWGIERDGVTAVWFELDH